MDLPCWCCRQRAGQREARIGLLIGQEFSLMRSLSSRFLACWMRGWSSSKVLSGAFLPANNGEGKHCVQIAACSAGARDSALCARNAAGSMYIAEARDTCFRCARACGTASRKLRQPPESTIERPDGVTPRLFIWPCERRRGRWDRRGKLSSLK